MKYKFRARTKNGILKRGTVEANTVEEARMKVLDQADFIIDVEQKKNLFATWTDKLQKKFNEWEVQFENYQKAKEEDKKKIKKPQMSQAEFEYVKDVVKERLLSLGYSEGAIDSGLAKMNPNEVDLEEMCFALGLDEVEYKSLRRKILFDGKHRKLMVKEAKGIFKFNRGVSVKVLIEFTEGLSILLKNNVELKEAIRLQKEYMENKTFRRALDRIESRIEEGNSLSRALYEYQNIFSTFYISLVELGEQTGDLEYTLLDVVKLLKINYQIKRELRKIMVYPILIMSVLILFIIAAKFFLIPQFKELFTDMGIELPLLTQMVFLFADYMLFFVGGFAIVGVAVVQLFLKSAFVRRQGKMIVDYVTIKLPPFKSGFLTMNMLQFTSSLHISLKNGISTQKAVRLAEKAVGNQLMKKEIREAMVLIEEGNKLSYALNDSEFLFNDFKSSLSIGEKSGDLEGVLKNLEEKYEEDLEMRVEMLVEALQPMSIFIVGIVLLPILLGLYMPILEITKNAGSM